MQNEQLRHRINELRAHKAPFIQTPAFGASAIPPHFSGNPSSTMSSLLMQPLIDPASSTVPDHIGLAIPSNSRLITRNSEVAGFLEDDLDEPAKKKVRCVRYLDTADILTQTACSRPRSKFRPPHSGFALPAGRRTRRNGERFVLLKVIP
jgi:hypothetical protein